MHDCTQTAGAFGCDAVAPCFRSKGKPHASPSCAVHAQTAPSTWIIATAVACGRVVYTCTPRGNCRNGLTATTVHGLANHIQIYSFPFSTFGILKSAPGSAEGAHACTELTGSTGCDCGRQPPQGVQRMRALARWNASSDASWLGYAELGMPLRCIAQPDAPRQIVGIRNNI